MPTDLDRRLHDVGWGLLLAMTGVMWILPPGWVPEGAWLLGAATILLGLNVVRYFTQVPISGFTIGLGFAALLAFMARFWRPDLPLLAICLIVIGVSIILKPVHTRTV
jgi:hypothetical protein